MRLFYYVHTGHRIGLDRFRRAAAIINGLGDVDITLLCSDFRIASIAREFGIKRSVGIDVVRNIPQIATRGDKIIFDSAEHNPTMLHDMISFFSTFIRISDDPGDIRHPGEYLVSPYLSGDDICTGVVVDPRYFEAREKNMDRAFFFGDDDYEMDLLAHLEMFAPHKMTLGAGFYFFFDYEKKVASAFEAVLESDEYDTLIQQSRLLVSASPQAVLEHLASGGRPLFLQRPDYPRDFLPLFEELRIPVVDGYKSDELITLLRDDASHNYHLLINETEKIITFIKRALTL